MLTEDHPCCRISSRLVFRISSLDVTAAFIQAPQLELCSCSSIIIRRSRRKSSTKINKSHTSPGTFHCPPCVHDSEGAQSAFAVDIRFQCSRAAARTGPRPRQQPLPAKGHAAHHLTRRGIRRSSPQTTTARLQSGGAAAPGLHYPCRHRKSRVRYERQGTVCHRD